MNRIRYITFFFLFAFTLLLLPVLHGQVSQYVVEVKVPPAFEQTSLSVSVDLTQNTQIQRVLLHYREFGVTEYKEIDMLLSGRTAVATIPAKSMTPPYVDYYIELRLGDNTQATFPSENPEVNPIKIPVKGVDPKDVEVRFLSPEQGETLTAEDLAIAVSLMFTSEGVDKRRTHIYLDDADVTNDALLSDDVILYSPKNFEKPLTLGTHSVKIELRDTLGNVYYTKRTDFNLSTSTAIEEEKSSLQYAGNGQVELRNEKIDVTNTTYQRGDLHMNGTYKYLMFGGDIHVTNEEQSDRQPQNRFLGTLQVDEYAKVQVGDAYPQMPSLIVSGKRVRGITGSLTFGFFNVDVSYGKTERAIEGTIIRDTTYTDTSSASARPVASLPLGELSYRLFNSGTFDRDFFAIRPSFGSGEHFQLGITYMKAKDDSKSITYGTYPQENFVAGADLLLAFDNQKIRWTSQAAMSMTNNNIAGGNWTDDDFKNLGIGKSDSVTVVDDYIKTAKLGRNFITVNDQLWPVNPASASLPSLSYESELSLNYFNNFVHAMIFRRGLAYKSFGNDFIQTDIVGLSISDRIRLLDNKMLLSASYETKSNNTQNDANTPTTTYNTLNTYITVFPGANLPSFTVGYGMNTRKNPIDLSKDYAKNQTIILEADTAGWGQVMNNYAVIPTGEGRNTADEMTNRFFLAANYDFNLLTRQSATLSASIANKKDNTFYKRDQDNVSFSAALTTFYKIPLQTTIAFILSRNETYAALQDIARGYLKTTEGKSFNYQTVSLNMRYRILNDRLNLMAAIAPSSGDFKRLLMQGGIDYQVVENHFLAGQVDVIQYPGKENDVIGSIIYRFIF
jgi:hypothetical protein